jgi:hypothetical protein
MINKEDFKEGLDFYYFEDFYGYGCDYFISYLKVHKIFDLTDEYCYCESYSDSTGIFKSNSFYLKECFLTKEEAEAYQERYVKEKTITEILT